MASKNPDDDGRGDADDTMRHADVANGEGDPTRHEEPRPRPDDGAVNDTEARYGRDESPA